MPGNGQDKGKPIPPILIAKVKKPDSNEWINVAGAVPFKDGTGYNVDLLAPIPENWDRKFVVLIVPIEREE
jgi:hypothetical protein